MKGIKKEGKFIIHTLSIPFIYGIGFFLILMHLFLELYHQVAFRMYGLDLVDSKKYFKIDRHKLSKLSLVQRFNCMYCGYANGLLPYATEITAQTEKYWCPIKHKRESGSKFIEPKHHKNFAEYNEYQ